MNIVILTGYLTKKPILKEIERENDKIKLANTSLAINKKWRTTNNEIKERVVYIDLNIWGVAAENAEKYLTVGSKVNVQGELFMDQWIETKDENTKRTRTKHSIEVKSIEYLDKIEKNDIHEYKEKILEDKNNIKELF